MLYIVGALKERTGTSELGAMGGLKGKLPRLAALFFLVMVMRALFATVDRRSLLLFGTLTVLMVIASYEPFFDPAGGHNLDAWFTILFFFEVARQAVRAVRSQVHGSWIIGIGAVLFITNGVFLEQYYQYTGNEMVRWLRTFLRFSYYLTMPVTIELLTSGCSTAGNVLKYSGEISTAIALRRPFSSNFGAKTSPCSRSAVERSDISGRSPIAARRRLGDNVAG